MAALERELRIHDHQNGENLNRPLSEEDAIWECNLLRPGGGHTAYLSRTDMDAYNRDPDPFAAGLFGLTKDEYREWVTNDGMALCGERTKSGRQCRSILSAPLTPIEWKKTHRQLA